MDKTKISGEVKEKAQALKESGATESEIATELNISKASAHRLTAKGKTDEGSTTTPPEPSYLDSEARFSVLLKQYNIANTDRIVNYCSSLGQTIYQDPMLLARALSDQLVPPGRAFAVVRHWCVAEGIKAPPELSLPEAIKDTASTTGKPEKWTVINGRPTKDPDGEFDSFLQAYKIAELERKPQQASSDSLTSLLLEQLRTSNERVEALIQTFQNQRLDTIERRLEGVAQGQQTESKVGLLNNAVREGFDELRGLRTDVKSGIMMQIARGEAAPPPRSPQEKQKFTDTMSKGIDRAEMARAQARQLWNPSELTPQDEQLLNQQPASKPRPPAPPSPTRTFE